MSPDFLYFIVLSSPISSYIVDLFKFICQVCFNLLFKCYSFSSEKDSDYTKQICEHISKTASYIEKKSIDDCKIEPEGTFFSFRHLYFGYIKVEISQKEFESIKEITVEFYGKLPFTIKNKVVNISNEEEEDDVSTANKEIKLYLSRGSSNPSFRKISVYYNDIPYPFQQEVIESITDCWRQSKFKICRAMICGKSNIGKSTIGRFLSMKLNGNLCFDIDLFAPGNSVMTLYDTVEPSEDNPLIIQIDEFDKLIDNIHNEKPPKKVEWLKNVVYNKSTYNSFMSEYATYLPHVIWLFTSNKPVSYFENLDASYVNDNRIDYKKELY